MKKTVWMSFDLGVKGDYEGLYRWLDSRQAKECGDSVALFYFEPKTVEDLPSEIEASVRESVNIDSRARVYIIFLGKGRLAKGRFLFGQRRVAPWTGFAPNGPTEDDG
jgi:hypothetical protein